MLTCRPFWGHTACMVCTSVGQIAWDAAKHLALLDTACGQRSGLQELYNFEGATQHAEYGLPAGLSTFSFPVPAFCGSGPSQCYIEVRMLLTSASGPG